MEWSSYKVRPLQHLSVKTLDLYLDLGTGLGKVVWNTDS